MYTQLKYLLHFSLPILVFHSVLVPGVALCFVIVHDYSWTFIAGDKIMKTKCYRPFQALPGGSFMTFNELPKKWSWYIFVASGYNNPHIAVWFALVASWRICIRAYLMLSTYLISDTIMVYILQWKHQLLNSSKLNQYVKWTLLTTSSYVVKIDKNTIGVDHRLIYNLTEGNWLHRQDLRSVYTE